ncbi:WD40 repeat-like protein, partial [Suillus brevipes Sb2]
AATGLPLGKPFLGHINVVSSVSFLPDGTRIVSGSEDHTVRVWDAATGLPLGKPFQHNSSVLSVSFSPDGTRIVSGSSDCTVRVWDAATGLSLGKPFLGHINVVSSVSFSPDGTRIVSGSQDSTVRVWDAATAQQFQEHTKIHSSASSLRIHHTMCSGHHTMCSGLVVPQNGWMMGADGGLLFWVPYPTRDQPFHSTGTIFAIPSGLDIDLSRMSHGERWANCRDALGMTPNAIALSLSERTPYTEDHESNDSVRRRGLLPNFDDALEEKLYKYADEDLLGGGYGPIGYNVDGRVACVEYILVNG